MNTANDPRLTAYVLGELSHQEREELEAELKTSPSAREALEEISETIGWIRNGFSAQAPVDLAQEQTERILNRAERARHAWLPRPWKWAAGLAAAACLVLAVGAGLGLLETPRLRGFDATRHKTASHSTAAAPEKTRGSAEKLVPAHSIEAVPSASVLANKPKPKTSANRRASVRAAAARATSIETQGEDYGKWLNSAVTYIISPDERAVFQKLGQKADQEQFVEQFWYRRDPDPTTPVNEFKMEHERRVAEANGRFSTSGRPGWTTDRGRIWIVQGPPTRIERHPSGGAYSLFSGLRPPAYGNPHQLPLSPEAKNQPPVTFGRPLQSGGGTTSTFPFEIWRYDKIEGVGENLELEFVDPSMSGEYRLALSPEEKDALLHVPGAGITLAEEKGKKQFYFTGAPTQSQGAQSPSALPGPPRQAASQPAQPQSTEAEEFSTETYDLIQDNKFIDVLHHPLSTFSIDVDTASYSNIRRFLDSGQLPPKDAVRIEEMLNYFPYHYAPPAGNSPVAVHLEVASAPWRPEHRLVRIGIKAKQIDVAHRPASNLVFLIDVSGSMDSPEKLPLLKEALRMLIHQLDGRDRLSIVVYAGASGLVLAPTRCSEKQILTDALERLEAGGGTNGGAGIDLAYRTALEHLDPQASNRVILATDGDFNLGVTSQGDLIRMVEERAKQGVFLTVLGFGMGNYKDSTLEKLADKGNGNYAYIDTLSEANKVLVEELAGTLLTLAKDVKIQVEFNPAQVQAYRLLGYENRLLADEDFNDDKKDAGEIGAGLSVTALYEIATGGSDVELSTVDPLKYQKPTEFAQPTSAELLTVKLRYKEPNGDNSQLLEFPLEDNNRQFDAASPDFRFAAAVASFGMLLRDSPHKGTSNYKGVVSIAQRTIGDDPSGYRTDFIRLVQEAEDLQMGR